MAEFHAKTELRIAEVQKLVRTGVWKHGTSAYECSQRWELSPNRAYEIVDEAFKRLGKQLTDPGHVKGVLGHRLTQIALEGSEQNAINAARVLAQIAGANAPTQIQLGAMAALTPEQRKAKWEELTGRPWTSLPEAPSPNASELVEERMAQREAKAAKVPLLVEGSAKDDSDDE